VAAFRRPIEQEQTVVETSMTAVPPLNCIAGVIKGVSDGSGIQCRRLLPGWEQIPDCERTTSKPEAMPGLLCLMRSGGALIKVFRSLQLAFAPLGGGSSSIENQTSICCLGPEGPHRRLSW
jgi:hypothetical protein